VNNDDLQGASAPNEAAEAAIARVLGAEREARASVEQARLEVERVAQAARSAARGLAERTERRIRCVAGAFERDVGARLAQIQAQAAGLGQAQPLSDADAAAVRRAVKAVAMGMVGVKP
jgi:hypothetical protein